ncbi:hypothetical protein SAMN06295879_2037 [Agreia bicolorata]|uniref:Uncharacterized protein n=1 Tax=Agreia bicolorata TaxID=110935 RepID=A0A1T4Y1A8_9MICO|nr:hypothetical protein [Agreia bicolorata]SKA95597.1 hypothetical protein SAMN06295879_2037 [Agreia bicolorata]
MLRLLVPVGVWGAALSILSFVKFPALLPQLIGLPVFFAGLVGLLVMCACFAWTRNQEELAGFTTLNGYARNLEQRDPHTRATIREAGEPFLEPSVFASLVAESKKLMKEKR